MREVGESMHVTTSTVSQQIAVLAQEAGTPLTEPHGRRVRLTPAGQRLAGHAVTILAAIEAARLDLDPAGAPTGTTLEVFRRFADHDWIVNSRNSGDEEVIRMVASLADFQPRITHRVDSLE